MPKPSAFVRQMQAAHAAQMRNMRLFTIQQCEDIMCIAAANVGSDPEAVERLLREYRAVFHDYAEEVVDESREDKEIWVSKDHLERALREARGEYYEPMEARYG